MKKLILGGVVILALLGAAPFVNGLLMQKTVYKAVEDANKFWFVKGSIRC